jgi:hypothetical protein
VLVQEKTAEELSHEWATKAIKLPRFVFLCINLYQFCLPIFLLIGLVYGIYFLYEFVELALIYRILFAGFYLPLFYAAYVWLMTIFCRFLNVYFTKKCPPREGLFSRKFSGHNVANPEVHYYHLRGFMFKWPVFVAKKSMFPWMQNYVLRKLGGNNIHRDALYGDCFVGLEFTELDEGAVMMDGATISGHVVDSIFGNLSVFTASLGKNVTMHSNLAACPGTRVEPTRSIGPKLILPKKWREKAAVQFQWGNPVPTGKATAPSFISYLPDRLILQWEKKQQDFNINIS